MKILVTGAAGMIGYHLCRRLKDLGHDVDGVDDFNSSYYHRSLKDHRARLLADRGVDVSPHDFSTIPKDGYDLIVHLAAHAQVRDSMDRPADYILNNVVKTQTMIEQVEKYAESRQKMISAGYSKGYIGSPIFPRVIYASTSCVMAGNQLPWREDEPTGHQLNPYGYTKRTNECQFMTSKIPNTIGLRFFTAYGPLGRPDMALFTFVKNILAGEPITLYNEGNMKRDFTYVEDVVEGIVTVIDRGPTEGHHVFNVGRGRQVPLTDFVSVIEERVGKKATIIKAPRHPADTLETWSDTTKLQALGWSPKVHVEEGVTRFVDWFRSYYDV